MSKNKKNNKKNEQELNHKLLVSKFINILAISMTVVAAIIFLVIIFKPFDYKNLEDIESVTIADYANKNPGEEYYVFLYDSSNYETGMLEDTILKFANYNGNSECKEDDHDHPYASSPRKIYVMDYNKGKNDEILNSDHLNFTSDGEDKIPTLMLISTSQKIASKFYTVSTIKTELYKTIC